MRSVTSTPTMTDDVVVYARYSTLMQDARSLDDQERRCRAYATAHGMHVVHVYSDGAVSGSHVER